MKFTASIHRTQDTRVIWNMLNKLRGAIDVEVYLRFLAPLLFLKAAIDQGLGSFATDKLEVTEWETLIEKLSSTDCILKELRRFCNEDEDLFYALRVSLGPIQTSSLPYELLRALGKITFPSEPQQSRKVYLDIVTQLLEQGGIITGHFLTPRSISELMVSLSHSRPGVTYHDPFAGVGTNLFDILDQVDSSARVSGQELNNVIWTVGKLALLLSNKPSVDFQLGNSLTDPMKTSGGEIARFDVVITDPPFLSKSWGGAQLDLIHDDRFRDLGPDLVQYGDMAVLSHVITTAKQWAATTALPNLLFRSSGISKYFRRDLIERDIVEAVILLPSSLRSETRVPNVIFTFDLSHSSKPSNQVLFIDASESDTGHRRNPALRSTDIERITRLVNDFRAGRLAPGIIEKRFATIATTNQISEFDFDLSLSRYVDLVEEVEIPTLKELRAKLARDREALAASEAAFNEALSKLVN